jgi:hypothetical protein
MTFDSRSRYQSASNPQVPGPVSKLGYGTGRTGIKGEPGSQVVVPGYAQVYEYFPSFFGHYPRYRRNFTILPPKITPAANDGLELVGTYRAHDFIMGQRFFSHMRRAPYWQIQEYPPNFRNLLEALKVERFRTESRTVMARPLSTQNYFLGYVTNPDTARRLGTSSSAFGSLGSV